MYLYTEHVNLNFLWYILISMRKQQIGGHLVVYAQRNKCNKFEQTARNVKQLCKLGLVLLREL